MSDVFRRTLSTPGEPISTGEYRRQHASGEWRWFEAIGTNQLENPAIGGIVVNARDITDARLAKDELARQRELLYHREKLAAMGSLLAGVAHELKNPLSVVVGRAIMLEEDAPDPDTASAAQKLRTAAERCSQIVKTFLSMARQQTPLQQPINLNGLLDECLEILAYGLRSAGIERVLNYAEHRLAQAPATASARTPKTGRQAPS